MSDGRARKALASRLIALGAIPIAVFCAAYLVARSLIRLDPLAAHPWLLGLALAAALASLFVLAILASRVVAGEVESITNAVAGVAKGAPTPELPELTPPLEDMKRELLVVAQDGRAQYERLQERLDTARQQIFFLANNDSLTGLANRKCFEERLEVALASAREDGATHALLYIDIDLLQRMNDAFGHLAGDELLRRIAPVLQSAVRDGDLLARIGGDEFAVLIENCDIELAREAGTHVRDAVQGWQFEWGTQAFQVGVSVGIAAITRLSPSPSAVLSEGDAACLAAKEQGRNRVFTFHGTTGSQSQRQTSRGWLKRINDAIAEGAFTLLYQPILPIVGAPPESALPRLEALLRMSDSGGELILPMSFIPVAERYDLMRTIDRWVIHRTFSDFRRLARVRVEEMPVELSINLSGHTLSSPDFAPFIEEKLTEFGVPPRALHFEITETAAIANIERARSVIANLRSFGVRFLLDDFGGGLSSFNYLKHFPVDGIKIDGLFVRGVAKNPLDYALVEAIHKIGTGLGLQTIAESVESEAIAKQLSAIGVTHGQGFHLCPPRAWEALFEDSAAV